MDEGNDDVLPTEVREARREILWTASDEKQTTQAIALFSDAFDHEVRGFHLPEVLPDGTRMRWMTTRAVFRLEVRAQSESLHFQARSGVAKNVLTVLIQGRQIHTLELSFDWQSTIIDLKPYAGSKVMVELRASRKVAATGDARELTMQFKQLCTAPNHAVPRVMTSHDVARRPDNATTKWMHPALPELPPFTATRQAPALLQEQEQEPSASSKTSSVLLAVKFFRPFDPTSEEVLTMASLLRTEGMRVHLACEQAGGTFGEHVSSKEELASQIQDENSMLILHHGTTWDYGSRLMQHSRARIKMLRYHNVSKSETFLKYPAGYLDSTIAGRFETTELAQHATHFTAPAYCALGDLLACGAPPGRLLHLPFLHDLGRLDGTAAEPLPTALQCGERFNLLVLGRQVPSKGLHHCLRVLGHYRRQHGDGIHLYFVGARDALHAGYFKELEQIIAQEGLEHMVSFHQEVNRAQAAAWLRGCDALLTMSESEAACVPILEAGWFGKPILGYQCGGKAEHAGPGQFLFETHDPALHAAAWHKLATDETLSATLGHMARQHVRTHFSTERIHARFLEVIRTISGART